MSTDADTIWELYRRVHHLRPDLRPDLDLAELDRMPLAEARELLEREWPTDRREQEERKS